MNGIYPLKQFSFYKPLVTDYLRHSEHLTELITAFPSLKSFERIIENKFLSASSRLALSEALSAQYGESINQLDPKVKANINLLKDSRTFTVCTGHQLNLFTGPLYFLIKIAQTISLSKKLKEAYPGYNFVPVYWMATEDHDLEEINHFHLFGGKIEWPTEQTGATGRMSTKGIAELADQIEVLFERKPEVQSLIAEIREAYETSKTLAEATFKLVHLLFNTEGIVVLDADLISLKKLFKPLLGREIKERLVNETLTKTNQELEQQGYHIQVNPREINLFYLRKNSRKRLVVSEDGYSTDDSALNWSQDELLKELEDFPDRFSPNAAFRPVYQELLLPNLATIGGPGEVSYWLQLKGLFQECKVDFPLLIMRNSFSFISDKDLTLIEEFNLGYKDLLQRQEDFIKQASLSSVEFDLTNELEELKKMFTKISGKVDSVDPNLVGRVHGTLSSAEKQLAQLEAKVVKSIKNQNDIKLSKLVKIQRSIFPNGALNERSQNFLEVLNYMTWPELKEKLLTSGDPLDASLLVETY